MSEKVMVLGAGTFQRGLLRYLNEAGYEIVIVGNRPADPGVSYAQYNHDLSYMDREKVLELFRSVGATQVFTAASDFTLSTQAYIQNEMKLRGFSPDFINDFIRKDIYKNKLKGIEQKCIPAFEKGRDKSSLRQFYMSTDYGIVVKPRSGSGSTGLTYIRTKQDLEDFEWKGDPHEYLLEEYRPGREVGGDLILYQGEIIFYQLTVKGTNLWGVPQSHLVLERNGDREIVLPMLEKVAAFLNLKDGIYNADIIIFDSSPYLIDMSPRIGGNCIPDITCLSTGVNEWKFLTELWLSGNPELPVFQWNFPHGVYIIGSEKEGVVKEITAEKHPFGSDIVEIFWRIKPGDRVKAFTQGANHLGYVIYRSKNDAELLKLQTYIESFPWFSLE